MKILHTEASCGWGGQEIRILEEARGLIQRGHEVSLACPSEARIREEADRYGVPAVSLPIGRKNLGGLMVMRQHIAQTRPDVINTHSSTDSWLAAIACTTLVGAPPIVRTRHISSPIPSNASSRWLYQRATSVIVTTGEALREQLISCNGFDAARIVSVTTGMDSRRYTPGDRKEARRILGLPDTGFLYGIVATLRFQKGHAELLHAFAEQDDTTCHLAIVGDGPMMESITHTIDDLGLTGRVHLPGNQHEILPWYRSFDVFVLPTHAEGMPQSLMQAMLCGLPVITTPVGSIPQVVVDGQHGILVTPMNTTELSGAMRRVRQDPHLRERLGQAGRKVALERFDSDNMLDAMEAIFFKVKQS